MNNLSRKSLSLLDSVVITVNCVMCAIVQEIIIASFALVCCGFLTCSNSGTSAESKHMTKSITFPGAEPTSGIFLGKPQLAEGPSY